MTASVTWTPTRLRPALRGGIGYLPTVAFGLDLVLVTISVLAAVLGRELLPFTPASSALSVGDRLAIAGPAMILGWVGMIYLFGGHRADVFGAGTDEYQPRRQRLAGHRRRGGDRLLPAPLPAAPRILRARLRDRYPAAGRRAVRAAPQPCTERVAVAPCCTAS